MSIEQDESETKIELGDELADNFPEPADRRVAGVSPDFALHNFLCDQVAKGDLAAAILRDVATKLPPEQWAGTAECAIAAAAIIYPDNPAPAKTRESIAAYIRREALASRSEGMHGLASFASELADNIERFADKEPA